MNFFDRFKKAIIKIKGKLIVASILILIIIGWGVAPFSVSIKNALSVQEGFAWDVLFLDIGKYITAPFDAVKLCFTETYWFSFWYVTKWFLLFYAIFIFIGIAKAFPRHEYDDIEHGSSDWSENGEQYKVLSKRKGIILAEKNYLPIDKRGNVNVLVVRRFWCW